MLRNRSVTKMCFCVLFICLCGGCAQDDPIKIGFVGGLTGRISDLGIDGRDGAKLAVDLINQSGGINGKQVMLVIKDDGQDPETAVRVDQELINEKVVAIIGHMTSSMSMSVLETINAAQMLMISPTTSTDYLTGQDDHFVRVYPSAAYSATLLAEHVFKEMGHKHVLGVYDLSNKAYSESYFLSFKTVFEQLGGTVKGLTFQSSNSLHFMELAERIQEQKSECVFIIASAMDTGMLVQQFPKLGMGPSIVVGEWSVTDDLLKYGAQAVNGIRFFHTFDRHNTNDAYVLFKKNFVAMFGHEPGFAAVHAYDSASALFTALKKNPAPKLLKKTILEIGTFQGLQGELHIDRYGDATQEFFLMTIKDNKFQLMAK